MLSSPLTSSTSSFERLPALRRHSHGASEATLSAPTGPAPAPVSHLQLSPSPSVPRLPALPSAHSRAPGASPYGPQQLTPAQSAAQLARAHPAQSQSHVNSASYNGNSAYNGTAALQSEAQQQQQQQPPATVRPFILVPARAPRRQYLGAWQDWRLHQVADAARNNSSSTNFNNTLNNNNAATNPSSSRDTDGSDAGVVSAGAAVAAVPAPLTNLIALPPAALAAALQVPKPAPAPRPLSLKDREQLRAAFVVADPAVMAKARRDRVERMRRVWALEQSPSRPQLAESQSRAQLQGPPAQPQPGLEQQHQRGLRESRLESQFDPPSQQQQQQQQQQSLQQQQLQQQGTVLPSAGKGTFSLDPLRAARTRFRAMPQSSSMLSNPLPRHYGDGGGGHAAEQGRGSGDALEIDADALVQQSVAAVTAAAAVAAAAAAIPPSGRPGGRAVAQAPTALSSRQHSGLHPAASASASSLGDDTSRSFDGSDASNDAGSLSARSTGRTADTLSMRNRSTSNNHSGFTRNNSNNITASERNVNAAPASARGNSVATAASSSSSVAGLQLPLLVLTGVSSSTHRASNRGVPRLNLSQARPQFNSSVASAVTKGGADDSDDRPGTARLFAEAASVLQSLPASGASAGPGLAGPGFGSGSGSGFTPRYGPRPGDRFGPSPRVPTSGRGGAGHAAGAAGSFRGLAGTEDLDASMDALQQQWDGMALLSDDD